MYVSKIGDILSCEGGVFEVKHQFVFEGVEYLLLSSLSASFVEIMTKEAPMYIGREIVSEDGEKYSIDFIEDQNLLEKIVEFLKENED